MTTREQTREQLIEARKLIEQPENWCRGEHENAHGQHCASGALIEVGASLIGDAYQALLAAIPDDTNVSGFNDSHSHAEVLDLFDRAIEAA